MKSSLKPKNRCPLIAHSGAAQGYPMLAVPLVVIHVPVLRPIAQMREFLHKPICFRENPPQILHVEIAPKGRKGIIIRLAFERVLLEQQQSALHSEFLLPDDAHGIPQSFSPTSASPIFDNHDVIKAVSANVRGLRPTVFKTTVPAHVDEDLCC